MFVGNDGKMEHMVRKILIFAGTTEGRVLTEQLLLLKNIQMTACTATDYGKVLLPEADNLTVNAKRLEREEMQALMQAQHFDVVYDATHPYALLVSENIRAAAVAAGVEYIRVLRPRETYAQEKHVQVVEHIEDAVRYLSRTQGKILSTIGSKELAKLCAIPDYTNRVYARILPLPEMLQHCVDLGFPMAHLLCMQGPFSQEFNTALIHQYDIRYVLTKESGAAGGFMEKVNSAIETDTTLLVIKRKDRDVGISLEEAVQREAFKVSS